MSAAKCDVTCASSPAVSLAALCDSLSGLRSIAYRPCQQGECNAHRHCRHRQDGFEHRRAADGGRPHADGLEQDGRQDQAAGRRRREPSRNRRPSLRARSRPSSPSSPMPTRSRRCITARRAAVRRREGQAVHRDEHGAAGGADGAGREGARQGRGLCRMPGRRLGDPGARGQAAGTDGRGARRRRARAADPRSAVPPRAARRSGRQRRGAEARGQPAADDLLAGARRAACRCART